MTRRAFINAVALLAVGALVAAAIWYRAERGRAAQESGSRATDSSKSVEAGAGERTGDAGPQQDVQAELPRLVDLGANRCAACLKLAPILEELRAEYAGRLDVAFIDVWKNPAAGTPYNIRLIPTQILFDAAGQEVWRHEGFIAKADLEAVFSEKVGVK